MAMGFSKIRPFYLLFAVFTFFLLLLHLASASSAEPPQRHRRLLAQDEDEDEELVLPTITKHKEMKSLSASFKSKAKSTPSSDSSDLLLSSSAAKTKLNKLHSTSKSPNLLKISSPPNNKTSKSYDNTESAINKKKKELGNEIDAKSASATKHKMKQQISNDTEDDEGDLVSDLADLPAKFQQTIIPDLKRISSSSQIYLSKANKEFAKGFKPYVGNKYAATAATAISLAFLTIPFLLVSLLFGQIKAYFSLQRLLIFIQVYLAIYFSILCLSSLVTGLEPLRFLYATSQATFVWVQVLQTLGYVIYLLLLLMYLLLVFSAGTGPRMKLLGLAQTLLGLAVGLHYYMMVFHRMVLRQPPKASWKAHAIYATCFLVICLLPGADARKKAYLGVGGEEGKKS